MSTLNGDEALEIRPATPETAVAEAAPVLVVPEAPAVPPPLSSPAVLPDGLNGLSGPRAMVVRPPLDLPLIMPREPAAGPAAGQTSRLEAFRPAEPRFSPEASLARVIPEPILVASASPPAAATVVAAPAEAPAKPRLPRVTIRGVTQLAGRVLKWGLIAFAAWFAIVVALTALFRFVNPPFSMLMASQRLGGQSIEKAWAPLETISPNLRRAVVTSEDAQFCHHYGFDFGEIRAAMRAGGEGFGRGASTISQQVAKNLFLWPGKSYVRKALEVPLTLVIEGLWPKRRIFEVYLNIAEWGPGVFGAEAAAQYYFSHPASELSEREAALMAVALPNPIARDASDPDPAVARRASRLQTRMRMTGTRGCVINLR